MLLENIARSQLLTLIDKFSEVLVTCTSILHWICIDSSLQLVYATLLSFTTTIEFVRWQSSIVLYLSVVILKGLLS